jgi:hypothetical protein
MVLVGDEIVEGSPFTGDSNGPKIEAELVV